MRVQLQQFATVTATPRTAWTFALLADGEGSETTVELTLGDRSERVAATLAGLFAALCGMDLTGERDVAERLGLARDRLRRDAVLATATSALRSAVTQLGAARAGVSLHRFLGAGPVASVELYANINRALFATDRTPADFALAAERAARAGFRSFKGLVLVGVAGPVAVERGEQPVAMQGAAQAAAGTARPSGSKISGNGWRRCERVAASM